MLQFQLFVSAKDGDLDPNLPQYICVDKVSSNGAGTHFSSDQLRTQYEALKNGTAPYLGITTDHCFLNLNYGTPNTSETSPNTSNLFSKTENVDLRLLDSLGYSTTKPNAMPGNADILLPQPISWLNNEYMTPTDQHVMWYWWHRKNRDLIKLKEIFSDISPKYQEDLDAYQNDDTGFPLGTFFMRSDLFNEYSSWMFTVIDRFMQLEEQSEEVSWVESLAPQIIAQHLLAIYTKHLKRTRQDIRVNHVSCMYFEHMNNQYLKPAFKNNNIAVVLASDSYYAPLMSVAIESIIRNSSATYNYDLIILENGLTPADFAFLQQQVLGRENFSLRILHLRDYLENRGLPTLAHISITAFARFLILDFLSAYSKVIYLDTDLVCTTDIAELYQTDVSNYLVAAVRDTADAGWCNITDNGTREHIVNTVKLDNVYDYFNSGVLVMNIEAFLRETSCYELLEMSLDEKWLWVDQDILNHVCAGKIKYLDQAWNFMAHKESYFTPEITPEVWLPIWLQKEYHTAHDNPKIVHYAGRATPCFSLYSDLAWYFWEYAKTSPYYEILVSIAASEMKTDPLNPISNIRKEREQLLSIGPLVTIIVPVYNAARFLPELFDSVLRQTHKNIEIICVNDGSEDNSLEVLYKYAREDDRIIVVDKENSGAGATRNLGMTHIRGKYICFVDSDDFIEENAIEQLVRAAEQNQTDVIIFGMDQYDDQTGLFSPNPWAVSRSHIPSRKIFFAAYIENFYKYLVGFTVNKFYRSSFLLSLDLSFPAIGAHEDMPFTYIALSASDRTYYLDKTLYHYRRSREGSLSDSTSNRYIYMLDALVCLKDGLIAHGLWKDYRRNFVNYALHMCIWKHSELSKFERLEFRDTCRTVWFERLDMLGHKKDYFFESDEYDFLKDTMNLSFSRKLVAKGYRHRPTSSKEQNNLHTPAVPHN